MLAFILALCGADPAAIAPTPADDWQTRETATVRLRAVSPLAWLVLPPADSLDDPEARHRVLDAVSPTARWLSDLSIARDWFLDTPTAGMLARLHQDDRLRYRVALAAKRLGLADQWDFDRLCAADDAGDVICRYFAEVPFYHWTAAKLTTIRYRAREATK